MAATGYITGFVTSADGTKIGYRQFGKGPGLILVHGGMMTAQNFMKLADYLAADFTVYVPDRQGRASSESHGQDYGLVKEAEDIQALADHTNTKNIFGLSSGALITLQTAIVTPSIKKIALYEPPIPVNSTTHADWYADYEKAIARGNYGKAFITILKGTSDTSFFTLLPSFITAPLVNMQIRQQEKNPKEGEMPLLELIKAFRYDYKVLRDSEDIIKRAKHMRADVLLVGGTKSPKFLVDVLDRLDTAIPRAERTEIRGVGHTAANNDDQPDMVADVLKAFFLPAKHEQL